MDLWKIGEVAKRTGLTVRTLHHYDALGLLRPSRRSESGYRLYDAGDLARLQQILSLRHLGLSLPEIQDALARPEYALPRVLRLHAERLREGIARQQWLCERLEALAERFASAETVSAEELLQTMEDLAMFEKYYTPEQLAQLEARRKAGGEAMEQEIREAPQKWAELHADVKAAMDAGVPPTDPRAQELAKRWLALVSAFTGGDPGIFNSLRTMYHNEDNVMGTDVKAMRPGAEWLQKAAEAAGIKHPGQ